MAFEQGRTLPTPEVIPFRLTRDLVSGMGLTGVVGVFQRCCEETMEVMRTSHEELRTIVEVSSVSCGMRLLACAWGELSFGCSPVMCVLCSVVL